MSPGADATRLDRALFYGDGVFRTALIRCGRVDELDDQIRILARDAHRLAIDPPEASVIARRVGQAIDGTQEGVLRILCCRANDGRGYASTARAAELSFSVSKLPAYRRSLWTEGASLSWSSVLLGVQPRLAGIKHLNRLEQVMASRELGEGIDEVLMCDVEGRVIGGSRSNTFFLIDGVLVTPDLSTAGIAGRMREKIIKIAAQSGIDIEVGLISPDEVRHAKEVFMSNSLIGIWPIRRLGELTFAAPGRVTAQLGSLLNHPWMGE